MTTTDPKLPSILDDDEEETTDIVTIRDGVVVSQKPTRRDRLTLVALVGDHTHGVIAVTKDEIMIGRGRDADVRLDDRGLSRKHVRIYRAGADWIAEDLGSQNGTFVDGVRIAAPHRLEDGARLQIGPGNIFRVALHDEAEQEATRRLAESAVTDPLTKTFNRRYLDARLDGELAYASRHGTHLSVLLLDVDHFKSINDTIGHLGGDAVLRVLGGTLRKVVRAEDVVARYGGEEFAIVARGIDAKNALILGDRIRRFCERVTIPWEGKETHFTVSIGIATYTTTARFLTVKDLLAAADAALYRAKREGRNRCCG
jgi:diguanylate cyclase (GGDEF)-like protein